MTNITESHLGTVLRRRQLLCKQEEADRHTVLSTIESNPPAKRIHMHAFSLGHQVRHPRSTPWSSMLGPPPQLCHSLGTCYSRISTLVCHPRFAPWSTTVSFQIRHPRSTPRSATRGSPLQIRPFVCHLWSVSLGQSRGSPKTLRCVRKGGNCAPELWSPIFDLQVRGYLQRLQQYDETVYLPLSVPQQR